MVAFITCSEIGDALHINIYIYAALADIYPPVGPDGLLSESL